MATTPQMTRDQFIAKYALGPGGTFLADDKGGNAASEVAGQNVADYYDKYLGPNAQQPGYTDSSGDFHQTNWGGGIDRGTGKHVNMDAWSYVDPHPISESKSGWDTLMEIARPAAALAAIYFGGAALASLGSEAGAVASTLESAGITPEAWAAMGEADQAALLQSVGVDAATATEAAGSTAAAGSTSGATGGGLGSMVGDGAAATGMTEEQAAALQSGMDGTGTSATTTATADAGAATPAASDGATTAAGGNSDKAFLHSNAGYGELASPAELAAAQKLPYSELLKQYGPSVAKLIASGASLAAVNAAQKNSGVTNAISGSLGTAPIDAAMHTLNSMGSDYETIMKPWLANQVQDVSNRSNAAADKLTTMAGETDQSLAKYRQYVDRIGTDGYREQQRGNAMADVQQQSDQALASATRNLERMGVNPSDGAMAGMQSVNATNTAANKSFAAANAEKNSWDLYQNGLKGAFGMGQQDMQTKAGLLSKASDLGQIGLNAGLKAASVDAGYRGGLSNAYTNVANADTSRINAGTSATQVNNQQNQFDQKNSLGGVVAGVATDLGGKALTSIGSKVLDGIFT